MRAAGAFSAGPGPLARPEPRYTPAWLCDRNPAGEHPQLLDMWVIFMDISAGQGGLSSVEVEARRGCCRSMLDSVC